MTLIQNQKMEDETLLHILLTEVESMVNSRPLTDCPSEPGSDVPLTPNHLLRMNRSTALSFLVTDKSDCYADCRDRLVQYMPPTNSGGVGYRLTLEKFSVAPTAAILSSISCSHYDFLHKPNKNNLCSAPITLHTFRTVYFSSTLKHVSSFLEALVKALRICQSSGSQTFFSLYLRLRV